MSTERVVRRQLLVDAGIQGTLAARVVLYWAVCVGSVCLMLICWRILTGPKLTFYQHVTELWYSFAPALVASLILLPMMIVDALRWSNRLVGPLLRLRRAIRALGEGEQVEPIRFRHGDFWKEFADEFNAMVAHTQNGTSPPEPDREPAAEEEEPVAAV